MIEQIQKCRNYKKKIKKNFLMKKNKYKVNNYLACGIYRSADI